MQEDFFYYPYSSYLKKKYGEKVYKLPVNLPVTCPNRENGSGGCAFCAQSGTGFESCESCTPVKEQLAHARGIISRKYHAKKYIAYFQNYTNTYLPVGEFSCYLQEAAGFPDIVEIAVSTRPDCIAPPYLEVLDRIRKEFGVPGVKTGTPYLLTGTYTGKSVQFKLNGTLLAELPAPSGARGRITLHQNWWNAVCISKLGFE